MGMGNMAKDYDKGYIFLQQISIGTSSFDVGQPGVEGATEPATIAYIGP
jgi:hypothetical protein